MPSTHVPTAEEMNHRPRGAETLTDLVAVGPISGPRAFAIVQAVRVMDAFRAEVERARAGDTTVSVAAQAIACAQAGARPACGVCLGTGATYPGCEACGHTGHAAPVQAIACAETEQGRAR